MPQCSSGIPDVDRILIFDRDGKHRGVLAQFRFYRELRRERYQLVVAMQTAMWSHLVAFLSGAPYRLGRYQKRFKSTLTHAWRGRYRKGETHEVDRNLELVRLICDERDNENWYSICRLMRVPPQKHNSHRGVSVTSRFSSASIPVGVRSINAGPEQQYAELADRLARHYNATILLFQGARRSGIDEQYSEGDAVPCYSARPRNNPRIRGTALVLRLGRLQRFRSDAPRRSVRRTDGSDLRADGSCSVASVERKRLYRAAGICRAGPVARISVKLDGNAQKNFRLNGFGMQRRQP